MKAFMSPPRDGARSVAVSVGGRGEVGSLRRRVARSA